MVHVRLNRNTDRSQYSPGPPVSCYSTAPPGVFLPTSITYRRNYSGGLQRGVKFGRRLEKVGRAIGRHLLALALASLLASFCARRFREISWRARRYILSGKNLRPIMHSNLVGSSRDSRAHGSTSSLYVVLQIALLTLADGLVVRAGYVARGSQYSMRQHGPLPAHCLAVHLSDEEDNVLTKAMWQSIGGFESGAFAGGDPDDDQEKSIQKAFGSIDIDGDGRISGDELLHWVTRGWGPNEASEDVAKLVTAADGDGDGFIDYAEFRGAVVNAVSSLS